MLNDEKCLIESTIHLLRRNHIVPIEIIDSIKGIPVSCKLSIIKCINDFYDIFQNDNYNNNDNNNIINIYIQINKTKVLFNHRRFQ